MWFYIKTSHIRNVCKVVEGVKILILKRGWNKGEEMRGVKGEGLKDLAENFNFTWDSRENILTESIRRLGEAGWKLEMWCGVCDARSGMKKYTCPRPLPRPLPLLITTFLWSCRLQEFSSILKLTSKTLSSNFNTKASIHSLNFLKS